MAFRNGRCSHRTLNNQDVAEALCRDDNIDETAINKLIAGSTPDDTVVMTVPARASLLEGKDYAITAGEIKRRMASPERLSVNDLLKILKESKIPENTKILRQKLEEQGLLQEEELYCEDFVPTGFLSLSEAEAKEMAEDFVKLTNDHFPVEEFAQKMACIPGIDIVTAEAAMEHLDFMIEMFESNGSFDEGQMAKTDKHVQQIRRGMIRLSNASHGFAKPSCVGVLRKLKAVAATLCEYLVQKQMQPQLNPSYPQIHQNVGLPPTRPFPTTLPNSCLMPPNATLPPSAPMHINQQPFPQMSQCRGNLQKD